MSKSRTGRKGRVRAAVAAALGSLDASQTGNAIVNAAGRLGTGSGFRSDDADKTDAQILDYIQGELNKPGSANAIFQQGEVRGALPDSVDTQNGAAGTLTAGAGGIHNAITGEASAAATAGSPLFDGEFAHYVMPNHVEFATDVAARREAALAGGAANGNALGTVVAGPAQAVSTDVRGILYHNGGPGSDLVPARDCGASGGNVVSAANFIINPSMEDLFNDEAHPNPTNIRICALGAMAAVSGGAAGVNGDTLLIADSDQNTNAVASVQFDGVGLAGIQGTGGAGSGGMPVGGQMVIRGADGTVLLTIEAQANSGVGTGFDATLRPNNWTLSATTYADTQVGATGNGVNYWVFPRGNANANKIYVVAHDHANGGTAYPAGAGVNQAMAAFAQTVANAVSHWADTHGGKIRAAQNDATGAGNLPHNGARVDFTMRLHKGTEGNAPGGVAAEGFNTITAYNSSGQPIQAGATANTWFGNAAGNAFPTFVGFAGGADATLAQIAQDARLTATTTAQLNTDLLVPIEDLPVRVSYFTDDGCREATAPAGGVGGAVIDVNALVDDGANDLRLTFTVPAAMGGFAANGGVTQIRFDESATNGNALDDANAMAIGSNGLTAAALAADIADAINGLAAGNAQVNAATSDNGSAATGVAGVTATVVGTEVHCVLDGAGATSAGVADCSVVSTRNDGTTEIGAVSVNFSPTGDAARGAGWAVIWGPE